MWTIAGGILLALVILMVVGEILQVVARAGIPLLVFGAFIAAIVYFVHTGQASVVMWGILGLIAVMALTTLVDVIDLLITKSRERKSKKAKAAIPPADAPGSEQSAAPPRVPRWPYYEIEKTVEGDVTTWRLNR
jgi:hypothetical protein